MDLIPIYFVTLAMSYVMYFFYDETLATYISNEYYRIMVIIVVSFLFALTFCSTCSKFMTREGFRGVNPRQGVFTGEAHGGTCLEDCNNRPVVLPPLPYTSIKYTCDNTGLCHPSHDGEHDTFEECHEECEGKPFECDN